MALPPTVPTSFVPKQPVATTRRAKRGSGSLFLTISLIVMGLAVVGAGATFAYEQILESVRDKKAAELAAAEASINRETVDEFLRLQARLDATEKLLDEHISLSRFFAVLETLTLQTVSFQSLELSITDTGDTKLTLEGTAQSFNALAAQSAAFAAERRIREAIFSDIRALPTGVVTFSLQAVIHPSLIAWEGTPLAPEQVDTTNTSLPQEQTDTTTTP
ncbi:MAG: hypothetical protein AAB582_00730 [Patescibacteria group bacterium]